MAASDVMFREIKAALQRAQEKVETWQRSLEFWQQTVTGEASAERRLEKLLLVIREAHDQYADDVCWLDLDKIFLAAGLSVPDRCVGDKFAMLKNCARFIDTMCHGGAWQSYAELERQLVMLKFRVAELLAAGHMALACLRPDENERERWGSQKDPEAPYHFLWQVLYREGAVKEAT